MCPHEGITPRDERGDRRHPNVVRFLELLQDSPAIPTLLQRNTQVIGVQIEALRDGQQHIGRGDVDVIGEVRSVERPPKVIALPLLIGPERRLVRGSRVVPVGAPPNFESLGSGDFLELAATAPEPIRELFTL